MSVDIQVEYEAPPDFALSPPYYRPASSITLSCIATGALGSVNYQWESRYHHRDRQSLAYGERIHFDIMTPYDSGIHTCTITDVDGTTISTSAKVLLYGKLMACDTIHSMQVYSMFQVWD